MTFIFSGLLCVLQYVNGSCRRMSTYLIPIFTKHKTYFYLIYKIFVIFTNRVYELAIWSHIILAIP